MYGLLVLLPCLATSLRYTLDLKNKCENKNVKFQLKIDVILDFY